MTFHNDTAFSGKNSSGGLKFPQRENRAHFRIGAGVSVGVVKVRALSGTKWMKVALDTELQLDEERML